MNAYVIGGILGAFTLVPFFGVQAADREATKAAVDARKAERAKSKEEGEAFRAEQKAKREEHMKQQQEENKAFREGEKGKAPNTVAADIKAQREKQFAENEQFRKEQHDRLKGFVSEKLSAKNIPAEKQAEILKYIDDEYAQRESHINTQHTENIEFLDELAKKTDLTKEELASALKEQHTTQKGENKDFHEQQKTERKEMRTKWREEMKAKREAAKTDPVGSTDAPATDATTTK